MTRSQLEHVIRAAATIAGDTEIVVVGSQAILGRYPDAPPELLVSSDADVYPRNRPESTSVPPPVTVWWIAPRFSRGSRRRQSSPSELR